MTILILAAALAAATTHPATTQRSVKPRPAAAAPAGRTETLHVSAVNLDEEDGSTFTLKDAAGVKIEPVKVPLSICRKDHLGRLLPGLDVQMLVERRTGADGKPVRYVRPERFRSWCS